MGHVRKNFLQFCLIFLHLQKSYLNTILVQEKTSTLLGYLLLHFSSVNSKAGSRDGHLGNMSCSSSCPLVDHRGRDGRFDRRMSFETVEWSFIGKEEDARENEMVNSHPGSQKVMCMIRKSLTILMWLEGTSK